MLESWGSWRNGVFGFVRSQSVALARSGIRSFFNDVQWAEINEERGALEVGFYSRLDGEPWRIDYEDAFTALSEAKRRLVGEK